MRGLPFVVGEEPYCLWEWDFRERNVDFLGSIDPDHFTYLAKVHGEQLDTEPQRAAVVLRTAYHHGLETFFALLFAALQAPGCAYAWLQKYRVGQLRRLVHSVTVGRPIRNRLQLSPATWEAISERINLFRYEDPKRLTQTRELFADAWRRFAYDFLDPHHINEYNSVKHGFRAQAGGFSLAVGIETVPGEPAPPENMGPLTGSDFGTSYFVAEPIPQSAPESRHFGVRLHSLNWSPRAVAAGLELIGLSINNVVSCLKLMNELPGKDVRFLRPEDAAAFEAPWQDSIGVTHITLDRTISEEHVLLLSKEELLARYDRPPEETNAERTADAASAPTRGEAL